MWSITLTVGPVPFKLLFKTEEKAVAQWEKFKNRFKESDPSTGEIEFIDDFNQVVSGNSNTFGCGIYENMDISRQAHIANSLHQAKTHNEGQKAIEADISMRRGPPVLAPMGAGPPPWNGRA